jgi:hypothetical protein
LKFKIIGGTIELEALGETIREISRKLKTIAENERRADFVDEGITAPAKDVTDLKKEGNPNELI